MTRRTGLSGAWRRSAAAGIAAVVAQAGLALLPAATPAGAAPTGFVIEPVVTGLDMPVAASFAKDGRIFVAEKRGVIRVVQNGTLLPTPFIDISAEVNDYWEHGMLGMTLHPEFPTEPYVYALYDYDPPGITADGTGGRVARVERYTASATNTSVVSTAAGARKVLVGGNGDASVITDPVNAPSLTCWRNGAIVEDCIPQDSKRHAAGNLVFGTDGKLWFGTGDTDRLPAGPQATNTLIGAIARVDPATGDAPADNPFFDGNPRSNRSRTWAHGLRNPFRFRFHPATGELFIGDVGQKAWEAIHLGVAGKNYGWPCYEAGDQVYGVYQNTSLCQQQYAAGPRPPLHRYAHTTAGGSVTGGDWYTGSVYPSQYRGAYFFADYSQGWVKYLTKTATGYAVSNFAAEAATQGIVQLLTGPDTNLYWVSITNGAVYRLRYTAAGNTAPTAVPRADGTSGPAPLAVQFDGAASFDPDGGSLTYQWQFGDGTSSTAASPAHTYLTDGSYDATLTVRDPGGASDTETLRVTVGNAPTVAITAPADRTVTTVGSTVNFSGTASDQTDGNLTGQIRWSGELHHNVHTHPDYLPPTAGASGTVVFEDHGDDTFLRICASVTNTSGISATDCADVLPRTTTVTVDSVPSGRLVSFEDTTAATPYTVVANVGGSRTLSAPLTSGCYSFDHWSDGGGATHAVAVPTSATTYTATFSTTCTSPLVLHLPFDEESGSVAGDASDYDNDATLLNGASFTAGHVGTALALDGVDDIAAVNASDSLGRAADAVTVAAWVRRSTTQTGWRAVVSRQFGQTSADQLFIAFYGGEPRFGLNTSAGATHVGGGTAPLNQWVHLAGVYDGSTMRLYVDGVLRASKAHTGTIVYSDRPVIVGGNANGADPLATTQAIAGRIDDARLWTRALSGSEIAGLVSAGSSSTLLHLRFNEGTGTLAADSSTNGNNGTLLNGATWGSGRAGKAVSLDGTNDFVSIGDSPSLGAPANAFTVSAWVFRPGTQSSWRAVVSRQLGTASADQFFLAFYRGEPRFGVTTADGATFVGAGTAPTKAWVHLVGVYDGSSMRLYVNGELRASKAHSGTITASDRPMLVGGNANGADPLVATQTTKGRIDEVRLYDRAFTEAEVVNLFTNPAG